MSKLESERGRGGRKKYSALREEKLLKRPVILTKSKEEKNKGDEPFVPTIILKTREGENRAISPKPSTSKDPVPTYQIAPRLTTPDYSNILTKPLFMKSSVRFLDLNSLNMSESLLEYLTDVSDFLVVGCIGRQCVGKSTIMSHIIKMSACFRKSSPLLPSASLLADLKRLQIDAGEKAHDKLRDKLFRAATEDHVMLGIHTTEGIHAYVSEDRVIYLDCQPVQSASVLVKMYNDGCLRNSRDETEYVGNENEEEILSLQLMAFIFSISHVVLLVEDTICDPELIRLVLTAEMLKPVIAPPPDEEEHFPHVMIVHNKTKADHFCREKVVAAQKMYKKMFSKSNLKIKSGLGIANGKVLDFLSPLTCQMEPINFFMLPSFCDQSNSGEPSTQGCFKGHLGYEHMIAMLRQQVLGVVPKPLTYTSLTEKNWWHFALKVWDDIKKSSFFLDYGRLLPTPFTLKGELSSTN